MSSDNVVNIMNDIEEFFAWTIKNERLLLKNFFVSIKQKTHDDVYRNMGFNLDNLTGLSDKSLLKENASEFSAFIESVSLKYPVYLKSQDGKILASSKGMPSVKSDFQGDMNQPFKVIDSQGHRWLVMEKSMHEGVYRLGTLVREDEVENSCRQLIVDFLLTNESPLLDVFILDNEGKFLANQSSVFPGRSISGKEQQDRADAVIRSILETRHGPKGTFFDFSWTIPDLKSQKILRKKVFVEYDRDFDWFVGIGIDIEKLDAYQELELAELRRLFKVEMVDYLVFIAVLFVFLLMGGVYLGTKTRSGFVVFQRFIERANTSHSPIDSSRLAFDEFRELGRIANEMVEDRKRQKETILAYMKELKAANRLLKDKSDRDGLTGIHNRRYFDEALEKAWKDGARNNKPVSLGMIDIDFFKQYNDTYGHQKGDDCLITVAGSISDVLHRPYDLVARYGGEEFVVLFPDTDPEGAMNLAAMIKERIAEKNIKHEASGVSSRVTFSMGLATLVPSRETLPETIIKMADDALYKAKKEGRDRIIRAS